MTFESEDTQTESNESSVLASKQQEIVQPEDKLVIDTSDAEIKRPQRKAAVEARAKINTIVQNEEVVDKDLFETDSFSSCDFVYMINDCPTTYSEAMNSPHAEQWRNAIASKYTSLMSNNTWLLVERPSGANIIKSKWVFRIKHLPDGRVDRYKARLVVKGCSQKPGVDFFDTYFLVSKLTSIRCLLSLAAVMDYEIVQCDVTTAFLYGDLDEDIFMEQPEGYNDQSGQVCTIQKSLYGPRQAPLQWHKKITSA